MEPKCKMKYIHFLSTLMVIIASAGAFYVLADPAFSQEMKGSVVTLILIGGWTAVQNFWLGSSNESARKTDIMADKITS